jgi:dTDP-4-dehydrorhamnose reductase
MARPVVITGAGAQLAEALSQVLGAERIVGLSRRELDVTDDAAVRKAIAAIGPSAVLNCASYNAVDAAETHPREALNINGFAAGSLAHAAADVGAVFVHYSSDFVFDGRASSPYTEEDAPNPQSVYAASKLLGEWLSLEVPDAYVLRVESLFGASGAHAQRSSLAKIVAGLRASSEVTVFGDRTVSPSHVGDIARATAFLLDARPAAGLYHCVNSGHATWEEVAREAARQLGVEPHLRVMTMDEAKLTAPRPQYCALSNAKLARAGFPMPTWQDALGRMLQM